MSLPLEYGTQFREVLKETYFTSFSPDYLCSPAGEQDIERHVMGRMLETLDVVVPWVNDVFDLRGARILEIGCGTGSSTAAFAHLAAEVVACDISDSSLAAAVRRLELLGLGNVKFHGLSFDWARDPRQLGEVEKLGAECDVVLLEAVLEHLTIVERINVLQLAWKALRPGGILVVYETPNRLCDYDWHSFELPFFDWLPDELALAYASRTPRAHFSISDKPSREENLYRLGRGVSFHEIELAIGLDQLNVIEDGFSERLRFRDALVSPSHERTLVDTLRRQRIRVPIGFVRPSLDLVIAKAPGSSDGGALQERGERHVAERLTATFNPPPPVVPPPVVPPVATLEEIWSLEWISRQLARALDSKIRYVGAHPRGALRKAEEWVWHRIRRSQ